MTWHPRYSPFPRYPKLEWLKSREAIGLHPHQKPKEDSLAAIPGKAPGPTQGQAPYNYQCPSQQIDKLFKVCPALPASAPGSLFEAAHPHPACLILIALPAHGCSKMSLTDMIAEHMLWGTLLTYTGVPLQGVEPQTVRGLDNQVDNHGGFHLQLISLSMTRTSP